MNSSSPLFTGKSESQKPEIDTKDLGILEDQMNHEALAYRKCSLYAQYFTDPVLSNMAGAAAQHHKQHFDVLDNYLASHR